MKVEPHTDADVCAGFLIWLISAEFRTSCYSGSLWSGSALWITELTAGLRLTALVCELYFPAQPDRHLTL